MCMHLCATEQRSRNNANGKRPEPSASDPIFAAINKFNVQTPCMQENIKSENYILPEAAAKHAYSNQYLRPPNAHMCAAHLHKYNYGVEYLKLRTVGKMFVRKLKILVCTRLIVGIVKCAKDQKLIKIPYSRFKCQ